MSDLRQAIKVNAMMGNQNRIGVLTDGQAYLRPGTVVLFRDSSEERRTCTIETPIDDEWIERNIKEGNGIRTINTCVGFPLRYINEVLL